MSKAKKPVAGKARLTKVLTPEQTTKAINDLTYSVKRLVEELDDIKDRLDQAAVGDLSGENEVEDADEEGESRVWIVRASHVHRRPAKCACWKEYYVGTVPMLSEGGVESHHVWADVPSLAAKFPTREAARHAMGCIYEEGHGTVSIDKQEVELDLISYVEKDDEEDDD